MNVSCVLQIKSDNICIMRYLKEFLEYNSVARDLYKRKLRPIMTDTSIMYICIERVKIIGNVQKIWKKFKSYHVVGFITK